jgi:hypothetical protein
LIIDKLTDGKVIRPEEPGSLHANISSDGVTAKEEISQSVVREAHVVFRPWMRIKSALKQQLFRKFSCCKKPRGFQVKVAQLFYKSCATF